MWRGSVQTNKAGTPLDKIGEENTTLRGHGTTRRRNTQGFEIRKLIAFEPFHRQMQWEIAHNERHERLESERVASMCYGRRDAAVGTAVHECDRGMSKSSRMRYDVNGVEQVFLVHADAKSLQMVKAQDHLCYHA